MLLHNQRGAPISWEAHGRIYRWEPYGACELPDDLVPLLKGQGFPVDVTPVPAKAKAEQAAVVLSDDAKTQEITRLRKELADAEARAAEAKQAAEAADLRGTAARADADAVQETVRVQDEQIRTLRRDADEYQKLLAEAGQEAARLREQLAGSAAAAKQPATAKREK